MTVNLFSMADVFFLFCVTKRNLNLRKILFVFIFDRSSKTVLMAIHTQAGDLKSI